MKKRETLVKMRCTPEEKRLYVMAAQLRTMTFSDWARRVLLRAAGR